MSTLRETFLEELGDIYDAEKQLLKGLPKLARAAQHEELRRGFEEHLEQTEGQAERLEQVFEIIGEEPKATACKAMQGLLSECDELIKKQSGDAALICAAQKIEHYEIASYGSLQAWARLLDEEDAADLLEETLDEERDTDEQLTEMAESVINVEEEARGDEDEEEEEERQEHPAAESDPGARKGPRG
jgi:ferritin-like metal-binding protein YciE